MKLEFSRHVFEKYSNIKFHANPSSRSRVVPCGWTDSRTDMTKPIVSFRNFANASKNVIITKILYYSYNVCSFFGAFSYTLQSVYYNNSVFTPVRWNKSRDNARLYWHLIVAEDILFTSVTQYIKGQRVKTTVQNRYQRDVLKIMVRMSRDESLVQLY